MPRKKIPVARVGLLVLMALIAFAVLIFLVGDRSNVFRDTNTYKVYFNNVGGLQAGNPVQLNGVDVGDVADVRLPENPTETKLIVEVEIDRRYAARIREDSRARIKTLGLLGDKFVELTSGSGDAEQVPDGGNIQAADATDVDRLIASGEDVMDNVVAISSSLKAILDRLEQGEGLAGELFKPIPEGEVSVLEQTVSILGRIDGHLDALDEARGPIGRLLYDRQMGDQLARTLAQLEVVVTNVDQGDGLLPALIHDPSLKTKIDDTLAHLEAASESIEALSVDVREADGLLPKLLYDEAYAESVTDELDALLERLNSIVKDVDEGDGTVSRLLHDPSVYEALNDVIVGIEESWMLRWLIRNRQKAGIEKRYEDTVGETGPEEDPAAPQR
ncbi:MAG: MlaD family protein [Acidobacteriota bacterium]